MTKERRESIKLHPWAVQWLEEVKATRAKMTFVYYGDAIRTFSGWMSEVGLAHFNREAVTQFVISHKDKVPLSSLAKMEIQIRTFYHWLKSAGHAADFPLGDDCLLNYRNETRPDEFAITPPQYRVLMAWAAKSRNPYLKGACIIGWNTGLRLADVAQLRWDQVNLDVKYPRIEIIPQKIKRLGRKLEIPMLSELRDFLTKEFAKENRDPIYVLPKMNECYQRNGHNQISGQFRKLCTRLGLPGITFHSLRHGFVTRSLANGVPVAILSSITGQSIAMIQRYLHPSIYEKSRHLKKALEGGNQL